MKRRKFLFIIIIILLAGTFGYYLFESQLKEYDKISYNLFCKNLENGSFSEVQINQDKIIATDVITGVLVETKNPHSPLLEEYVSRYVDKVSVEQDVSSIINLIFDIIFYVFFFGIIIFVFLKFINPNTFKVVHNTHVKFDDVVGMDNLKSNISIITKMLSNPKEYAKKGIRIPKGILLEGDPGNGKTLFAKALAGESKINFIPAKATDFESMFMAIGPLKVKLLFAKARKRAPCIIFIDEFDGIGTVRNYSGSAIETENTRIVTALLNELDGFNPLNGVLVIAATNSIHALDPALIRPGRFDMKFTIPYPGEKEREQLIKKYCNGKEFDSDCSVQKLVNMFNGFSCAKIESVINSVQINASGKITLEEVNKALKLL